ncbi:phosphoribosylpyrophosphate synthetase [Thalassospira lucentensis]|uniref:Phosphoribosylpyrophosphate synthetase n=1 Tax=Thalassospira lucentensis TaxID=168935 RepID=A0A358I006_9PROT|nr:phosphoribosylpyrophosphate synthetase [Thalassospira lucentensis]HBV00744.1 phosphoribosylpyrophosphate synthetase [Thalassospira lucentensis]HCW67978.1 phosphoribosylpyrophosphate synthetase [Thalassospira lucentensis]
MTLADLQANAKEHGFEHHFICEDDGARSDGTGHLYKPHELRLVHSTSTDNGTDPGDDATLYMIEANDGTKGVMIIPNSFHADPQEARLIDVLRKNRQENAS